MDKTIVVHHPPHPQTLLRCQDNYPGASSLEVLPRTAKDAPQFNLVHCMICAYFMLYIRIHTGILKYPRVFVRNRFIVSLVSCHDIYYIRNISIPSQDADPRPGTTQVHHILHSGRALRWPVASLLERITGCYRKELQCIRSTVLTSKRISILSFFLPLSRPHHDPTVK